MSKCVYKGKTTPVTQRSCPNIGVQLGGGKGEVPQAEPLRGGSSPPEDLVQSRHSEISATFEIRKKSYWPYLCVLRPVDEIYRVSQKSCPLKK